LTELTVDPATAVAHRYPEHAGATRLYGEAFCRDPAAVFEELRAWHGPVAPALLDGDLPVWLVFGYRESLQVLENQELFTRDSRIWNAWDLAARDWPARHVLRSRDSVWWATGAEHLRRSTVLADVLGAVDALDLRAVCERIADGLVDAFAPDGRADLIAQFAELLPVRVVGALLGMPAADAEAIAADLIGSADGVSDAPTAYLQRRAATSKQLLRRRADPGSDLLSRLVRHPEELTDDQLLEDVMALTAISHQCASTWIGTALRLMLGDGPFMMTLVGGRRSVGDALAEVLWADAPSPRVMGRWAVQPTRLGSYRIETGDLLLPCLAAANADPCIRPAATAGRRDNHAHLAYGAGEHRCPFAAQEIGEIIAETAVRVLLDRLPDITLAVPVDQLVWRPVLWARALTALPVRFTPIRALPPPE
jgi:cytochrome P450